MRNNNESIESRSRGPFQESDRHGLEGFVRSGLEIMSRGDYEGAVVYFRNGLFTANPGIDVAIHTGSISRVSSYEHFQESLRLSNMSSHFSSSQMVVREFGDIALLYGFYLNSRRETVDNLRSAAQRAQEQAYHVVSLNYAQVWLSGLHYLEHGDIGSDFEAHTQRETYIGSYLAEHRVPLATIWTSRHPYAVAAYNEAVKR